MIKVSISCASTAVAGELEEKVGRGGFELTSEAADVLLTDDASRAGRVSEGDVEAAPKVILVLSAAAGAVVEPSDSIADYLFEPYTEAELWFRIRRATAGAESTGSIKVDGLVIHPDTYEVLLDGTPLNLTYKEYELLKFLASHPQRVWDRRTLLNQIWEYDYFGGTRTVDVHIRRLRAKLGPKYGNFIQTVRQVGYRFIGESS